LAFKLILVPAQVSDIPLMVGIAGRGITLTEMFAVEVQPFVVAISVYKPAIVLSAFAISAFCKVELNDLGPLHKYVVPPLLVSFKVLFIHTSTLGAKLITGSGLMATSVVKLSLQPLEDILTL
jgi:hypothetical protein